MKKRLRLLLLLTVCSVCLLAAAHAEVPAAVPDDLGGKTLYGYLVGLKDAYLPANVFQDADAYPDQARQDAKQAAALIVAATTAKMLETGTPDAYMLYLRAYANDLLFQASGEEALRQSALMDYQQVVELGGAYAQADYTKLAALELKAGPLSWQVPQMLTLDEMAAVLGVPVSQLCFVDSGYSTADGSRSGVGYALGSTAEPAASALWVLADLQGGKARYDALKTFAFLQQQEVINDLGDEAVLMGLRNWDNDPTLYATLLLRKEELVLQVRLPFAAWRGGDTLAGLLPYARAVAEKLLGNLYDTERSVPGMDGIAMLGRPAQRQLNPGTPDSPVPDEMPADLGDVTEYGYLVGIRNTYLPAERYGATNLTTAILNDARRAAALLVRSISGRFDRYGQNPYELEIRAACYRFAYLDSGDAAFRSLAINDYKQAFSTGYLLGKRDYDALAAPLIQPMAGLSDGASGKTVSLLQAWLRQLGYLDTEATGTFDGATQQAVRRLEADNSLPEDGVADIGLLLLLYSRIDDRDAPLP